MNKDSAILQLMHTTGIGKKKLFLLLKRLKSENYPIEDFVFAEKKELECDYNFKEDTVKSLYENREKADSIVEEFYQHDIKMVTIIDDNYPAKMLSTLEESAPPVLFYKGEFSILKMSSVGFCGSRNVSEKGLIVANDCSKALAEKDVNVVSGYAKGVDTAAHNSALRAGGVTTIVLAEGILQFRLKRSLSDILFDNNTLIISEFIPKLGWIARNAMQRNYTICGLSDALIVVESGLEGGTFEAGKAALKLNKPLFVTDFQSTVESAKGNDYLIKHGGNPLRRNKNGEPNLEQVLYSINNSTNHSLNPSLFD